LPSIDFNSGIAASPAIGFKAWDQTFGAAGAIANTTSSNAFSAAAALATLSVMAVNDAPSFTIAGTPVAADEDAGGVSIGGFATNIVAGPATATDEAGQTLAFVTTVVGTTGTLAFDVAPSIDPISGALTFTTSADTNGTATIDVVLRDNGSGVLPNLNESAVQEFVVTIAAVNDEQVLAVDAGLTVIQDSATVISSSVLETIDVDNPVTDLVYVINVGPVHGSLLVDGVPATQFSQQQLDTGAVAYQNDGTANPADSFDFVVDDGEGAVSTGTFNIEIRPNPGDFNQNLAVDAGDYVLWRKTVGATAVTPYSGADGNGDTAIDEGDYTIWQEHFGDAVGTSVEGGGGSVVGMAGGVAAARSVALAEQPQALPGVRGVLSYSYALRSSAGRIGVHDRPRLIRPAEPGAADVRRDDALVAWLKFRGVDRREDDAAISDVDERQDCPSHDQAFDDAFAEFGVEVAALV
jgi:hypothetical protein